jgi:hypothetical protein
VIHAFSLNKSLGDNISMIETDSKYVLWFKISKNIFRLQQDVLFGIVYIPPENSLYCVGDPFRSSVFVSTKHKIS